LKRRAVLLCFRKCKLDCTELTETTGSLLYGVRGCGTIDRLTYDRISDTDSLNGN